VVSRRTSESRPDSGIVTWHTEGFNQDGKRVIDFKRSNLIPK
jgi:acyl dehydratase